METVGIKVSKKLEGKKNLLLVTRSSVLEDTVHYMAKDGFNPSSFITVSGCIIRKVIDTLNGDNNVGEISGGARH